MDVAEHLDQLEDAGHLLGDAAARAELDAPVPTCPEWTVRDLLQHIGGVHRWATIHVRDRPPEMIRTAKEVLVAGWPADDDLLDWYRAGHAELLAALRDAPADLVCPTFLAAPSPLAMWARRQAHETAIHRVDAELAIGQPSPFDAAFGADGIDELLTCMLTRPGRGPRRDPSAAVTFHATDVDAAWTVRMSPDSDPRVVRAADDDADAVVRGPAAEQYLLVWNRTDHAASAREGRIAVSGAPALLDHWRDGVRIRAR